MPSHLKTAPVMKRCSSLLQHIPLLQLTCTSYTRGTTFFTIVTNPSVTVSQSPESMSVASESLLKMTPVILRVSTCGVQCSGEDVPQGTQGWFGFKVVGDSIEKTFMPNTKLLMLVLDLSITFMLLLLWIASIYSHSQRYVLILTLNHLTLRDFTFG